MKSNLVAREGGIDRGTASDRGTLVIVGAGGHATSCADVARSAGYGRIWFVDARKAGARLLDWDIVGDVADVYTPGGEVLVAIGDNASRQRVCEDISRRFPDCRFPPVVHATASISPYARIEEGAVAMAGAVVGPNSRCGRFCIVNTRASIDHDCVMEDFSSIAPGAVTGGGVRIGLRSAVGIGAVVRHGVVIGDDCVVGANSYVHGHMTNNIVCYGSPARVVRGRNLDDRYL